MAPKKTKPDDLFVEIVARTLILLNGGWFKMEEIFPGKRFEFFLLQFKWLRGLINLEKITLNDLKNHLPSDWACEKAPAAASFIMHISKYLHIPLDLKLKPIIFNHEVEHDPKAKEEADNLQKKDLQQKKAKRKAALKGQDDSRNLLTLKNSSWKDMDNAIKKRSNNEFSSIRNFFEEKYLSQGKGIPSCIEELNSRFQIVINHETVRRRMQNSKQWNIPVRSFKKSMQILKKHRSKRKK